MIKLKKEGENLMGYNEDNVACCYYPLNSEAKELDLPKLPPFEEVIPNSGYEEGMFGYTDTEVRVAQNAFKEGYKAAQSKQFTLEDMKKSFNAARETSGMNARNQVGKKYKTFNDFIQSLSTQQLPKEFILGIGDTIEEQIRNGNYR